MVKIGGVPIEEAFKINTTNPAENLGLKHKGAVKVGNDADFCLFDEDLNLKDVFARGQLMMKNKEIMVKGNFE